MSLVALCVLSAAIVASSAAEEQAAATLQTLEFEKPINWYFVSDIGLLHVHGDGEIRSFDLLDRGREFAPPLSSPLVEDRRSVVHLSGTSTLLIASAHSGKIRSDAAADGLSSYGVDLASGKFLWEQPALAVARESYYFPEEDVVILQSGGSSATSRDEFAALDRERKGPQDSPFAPTLNLRRLYGPIDQRYTAVDRSTGAVRWSKVVYGSRVVLKDDTLVILGPESSELDVRTGEPLWIMWFPLSVRLLFFPSIETAVHWPGPKSLRGYGLGESKKLLWHAEIKGVLPQMHIEDAAAHSRGACRVGRLYPKGCASAYARKLGDDRFLIAATFKYIAFDVRTGERLWTRKRLGWRSLDPSPSGKLAAKIHDDKLLIVDLATGQTVLKTKAPKQKRAEDRMLAWLNDTEFLIVFRDKNRQPTGVARYDCEAQATVWHREVRTVSTAAARMRPGGAGGFTLEMLQPDPPSRSGVRAEGGSRASGGGVDQEVSDAWTRFVTVRERVARSKDRELRFRAGHTLNVLDLASGELSQSLSYEAPRWGWEADWGSGLWVIFENGGRRVKVVGEENPQSEPSK